MLLFGEGVSGRRWVGLPPPPSLASDKFAIVGTALLVCKSQGLVLLGPVCSGLFVPHYTTSWEGVALRCGENNANSVAASSDLMALGTFPE